MNLIEIETLNLKLKPETWNWNLKLETETWNWNLKLKLEIENFSVSWWVGRLENLNLMENEKFWLGLGLLTSTYGLLNGHSQLLM